MITNKQIDRALRFARPVLDSHFDRQKTQTLLDKMKADYQELAPEVPSLKSSTNQMLLKIAVDTLALYRALLSEMSQSEALALIQPYVNNWMDGQFERWIVRAIYANRRLHLPFRRRMIADANRADELDGSKFEFIPPSGDLFYGITVVRCGVFNFLTRMGAPEIAPYLCQGDFHIQKYLPQGIVFERTQVIAEGGSCCDFRYIDTKK